MDKEKGLKNAELLESLSTLSPQQRALLALLILHANRVVDRSVVVDCLWGEVLPEHPFGLAVQWHPEWLIDQEPTRTLFRKFVEAAGK